MKGSTFKRCKCRDAGGKELGAKCPKLRRKNGTWNPRHGSWYYQLELEAGPNGKRRKTRRGGYATQDAAEGGLDEAKAKASRGVDPKARLTVGQFLDEWLAGHTGLRASVRKSYGEHITNHLRPHLGHIELDKLRVRHLAEMFEAIESMNGVIEEAAEERRRLREQAQTAWKAGDRAAHRAALDELDQVPPHRRTVGPTTMQRIRATLRSALSDAVGERLVEVNVAKLVKMPTGKRPKARVWTAERVDAWSAAYEQAAGQVNGRAARFKLWLSLERPSRVMVWTPAQTGRFLDQAAGHRLSALFHLVVFRGLRRGEACGVGWDDLDLDGATLTVRTSRVKIRYSEIEDGDPKTDASEDTIPLDSGTVKVLRRHRAEQAAEQLAWGEAWQECGKVFTREDGAALHPDDVSRWFGMVAFDADLPPIRFHDLRHGAATLMLAAGADMKLVQALLRHSSMKLSSDTYTSVLPEIAREAAEAAAALVPRAAAGGGPGTSGLPTASHRAEAGTAGRSSGANRQVKRGARSGAGGARTHDRRIMSQSENVPDETD